jgi:hypothetical protein
MTRNWESDLKKFESFLREINIQKYAHLRQIKTVEQDLPKELLPLEIFYLYYWETTNFKDYDEVFKIYWSEKLNPYIYRFVKKYFYGCSLQFVEEGFKARLYRIWMSILTQFHFQYLWNTLFEEKLISSAELDTLGIDAIVKFKDIKVAIQVKKVSYRREASDRRFTRRQQTYADIIVEIPYLVIDMEELKNKLKNPRVRKSTKSKCQNALSVFNKNFIRLDNGFVIFRKEYLKRIYQVILEKIKITEKGSKITYKEFLTW